MDLIYAECDTRFNIHFKIFNNGLTKNLTTCLFDESTKNWHFRNSYINELNVFWINK